MSLPWFALYPGDYLGDTMRLTTEAHGAYWLLLLDYYATGNAPPDDDEALATIARLPIKVWRAKYKGVLAPFFEIKEGRWFHKRVEAELRVAADRYTATIARAKAGAKARWGDKHAPRNATGMPQAMPPALVAQTKASGILEALPKPSAENAHLQPHSFVTREEMGSRAQVGNEGSEDGAGQKVSPLMKSVPVDGTAVSPNFKPNEAALDICRKDGVTDAKIEAEIRKFIAYSLDQGRHSQDWDARWTVWWSRWRERNGGTTSGSANAIKVTPADWHGVASRYAKNQSLWSRQFGPEPGHVGCRCPQSILRKYGIDPATGLKLPSDARAEYDQGGVAIDGTIKQQGSVKP